MQDPLKLIRRVTAERQVDSDIVLNSLISVFFQPAVSSAPQRALGISGGSWLTECQQAITSAGQEDTPPDTALGLVDCFVQAHVAIQRQLFAARNASGNASDGSKLEYRSAEAIGQIVRDLVRACDSIGAMGALHLEQSGIVKPSESSQAARIGEEGKEQSFSIVVKENPRDLGSTYEEVIDALESMKLRHEALVFMSAGE